MFSAFTAQSTTPSYSSNKNETPQASQAESTLSSFCNTNQVQVATQTPVSTNSTILQSEKKNGCPASSSIKGKKTRYLLTQQQTSSHLSLSPSGQHATSTFSAQNYQLDPSSSTK